jgi:hypothetical protein
LTLTDSSIPMDDLARAEYEALRATIRQRGTVRVVIAWATLGLWAGLAGLLVAWAAWPAAYVFSLIVLAAGFEAVFALHVGIERVGRYLQVFYEPPGPPAVGRPGWETAIALYGERHPGGGPDPLFTPLFVIATAANLFPVAVTGDRFELALIALAHAAALLRILTARRRAADVREVDLSRFRAMKSGPA